MVRSRLRRQIALEAARLIYVDQESEYYRAKLQAARRLCQGLVTPGDLPSTREIRTQLQAIRRSSSATLARAHTLHRAHAAHADAEAGPTSLARRGSACRGRRGGRGRFARSLPRLSPAAGAAGRRSSKTQNTIPRGTPCITACKSSSWHTGQLHYDEEFQLAALLHDVGKAIEPRDPVAAGLEALSGHITPRTAWLIEHQPHAAALREGSLAPARGAGWRRTRVSTI